MTRVVFENVMSGTVLSLLISAGTEYDATSKCMINKTESIRNLAEESLLVLLNERTHLR